MAEDNRQRAKRYLAMAETARDPHIANGLRLLAAAYLEMADKTAAEQKPQPQEQAVTDPLADDGMPSR